MDSIGQNTDRKDGDAPIVDRHTVYKMILDSLVLSPSDRDGLRKRGLSDAEIDRRDYRSYSINRLVPLKNAHRLARYVPGLIAETVDDGRPGGADMVKLAVAASGILIPARRLGGDVAAFQIRKHTSSDPKKRYAWVSTSAVSSGAPIHAPIGIVGPCDTVRITEGGLKADVAFVLSGLPTISFPGVSRWPHVIPFLFDLKARTVRLAFDADCRENINVAEPLLKCVQELLASEFTVELETWPIAFGKGIDDLLRAGRTPDVVRVDRANMEPVHEIVRAARRAEHAKNPTRPRLKKKKAAKLVGKLKNKSEPPDPRQVSFLDQKNGFDLANAVTQVCGPPVVNSSDASGRLWKCVFCERPTLRLWTDRYHTPRFKCINPSCGKGGDAPQFARLVHKTGFRDWCFQNGIDPGNRGKRAGSAPDDPSFASKRICTNRGWGKYYFNPDTGSVFKATPECGVHVLEICPPCYRKWLRINWNRFKLGVKSKQIECFFVYKCTTLERDALLLRFRRLAKRAKRALFWVSVRNDAADRCVVLATLPATSRKRSVKPRRAGRRMLWEAKFSGGWGKIAFSRNWPQLPQEELPREKKQLICIEIADDATHTAALLRTLNRRRLELEQFDLDGAAGLEIIGLEGNQDRSNVDLDAIKEEITAIVTENGVREHYGDDTGDAWGFQDDGEKGRSIAWEPFEPGEDQGNDGLCEK